MSDPSEAEIRRLDLARGVAQRSAHRWDARADELEARAQDMYRIARQLADHNAPLRRELEPVRHLHIAQTWHGRAASESRRRLDTHEDRILATARNIDDVIDDLTANAAIAGHDAHIARDNQRTAQRRAARLDVELGALDDVYL